MRQCFYIALTFLLITGCSGNASDLPKSEGEYFNLKGYFTNEIQKLNRRPAPIQKTVYVNGSEETKTVKISDWKKELSSFSDAEINRESWKGLFKTVRHPNGITYTSTDKKVPVKEVDLTFSGDRLTGIRIIVKNSNMLYSSTDSLLYYPDSLYQVKKSQEIKLLSKKDYAITGSLK